MLYALLWLKYHKYYQNIKADNVCMPPGQLPAEGNLTGHLAVEETLFNEQQEQTVNDTRTPCH